MKSHALRQFWTNLSVLALAGNLDPIAAINEKARSIVLTAVENGWEGPPFDIFALAEHLQIPVVPSEDIIDARTIWNSANKPQIEFNPSKPSHRIRYSIAHELAHTLFPDSYKKTRYRSTHEDTVGDEWQLESLCNIAAAEFLMPVGSLPQLRDEILTIERLVSLRDIYNVSMEALFLRVIKLTEQRCGMICASRTVGAGHGQHRYRVDYSFWSKTWTNRNLAGLQVPKHSALEDCTAIGFTSKRTEQWQGIDGQLRIESVGIPPYPNHTYPRVLALIKPQKQERGISRNITYVIGDATKPRGQGFRIIAQVVNDKASTWGGGFAKEVRKTWPSVQEAFKQWANENPQNFCLGNVFCAVIDDRTSILQMISQHGYGQTSRPGIRYLALRSCLLQLAQLAIAQSATIHMPRIGCGEARGRWEIVEELIRETLITEGIEVTVYDLPQSTSRQQAPLPLFPTGTP